MNDLVGGIQWGAKNEFSTELAREIIDLADNEEEELTKSFTTAKVFCGVWWAKVCAHQERRFWNLAASSS
jgi:hypothetical protein